MTENFNDAPAHPSSDEKRYKLYRLELMRSQWEMREDIEYIRISEPGSLIGILPVGEKDVKNARRFVVQAKSFHEVDANGGVSETGYRDVAKLIDYLVNIPQIAPILQSTTAINNRPNPKQYGLTFAGNAASLDNKSYRILPTASGNASVIPDKYKIKRSDSSDQEK